MIPCLAVPCDGVRCRPRAREGGGGLRASFLSPWCLLCEHCESGIKYLPHWVLLKKVNDFGQLYYLPQTLHCPIAVLSETCALASRPELLDPTDGTNAAHGRRSALHVAAEGRRSEFFYRRPYLTSRRRWSRCAAPHRRPTNEATCRRVESSSFVGRAAGK